MASIVKRKSKYSVVYDYTDENGKRRQRWETFSTNAEAKKRKKQIEYEQDSGTFFIPTAKTLNDLLDEYMSIYGVNTWAMSTYIFVNKELQRVTRGALDDLSDKGVIKKFPPCIASTHTALVLKEPKTKTSIRRVYLPKTVAYMLVERKKEIDELMDLFGDEYIDNNLVFCSSNGRPMESQVINRAFNKLIKENGLPHVVFHSLRHSSITYKLKLNGGDMKSVQGDSGHAQVKMVADVYSHIIDEDRCINAQRLEEAFYSSKTPDPVEDTEPKTADTAVTESDESDAAKILELLKNPETAALLKQLAKAL